jgi:hypothetical protein
MKYKKTSPKKGIIIKNNSVNSEIIKECVEFAKWYQKRIQHSIPVVVSLENAEYVITKKTKEKVSAIFWGPYDKNESAKIIIATGEYDYLVKKYGKFNALKAILGSLAHELIHYQQWIENRKANEQEARNKGKELVFQYIDYETEKLFQQIDVLRSKPTEKALNELFALYDKGSQDVQIFVIDVLPYFSNFEDAKQFLIKCVNHQLKEIRSAAVNSLIQLF